MSNYRQTSVNITPATDEQVAALSAKGYGTFTDIVRIAIDRMAREEGWNMSAEETIYRTPDEWGNEEIYANDETMNANIDELRAIGDGWENIELADCDRFEFVKQYPNGQMLYDQRNVRQAGYPHYFVFASTGNGYYSPVLVPGLFGNRARIAQYHSAEDADEDFA